MPPSDTSSLTLFCAAMLSWSCDGRLESSQKQQPIVGGSSAERRFPAVAKLALDFGPLGELVICGGTLIAPTVLLTAAHCTNGPFIGYSTQAEFVSSLRVVFDHGSAAVENAVAHPGFSTERLSPEITRHHRDVGVVIFRTPVAIPPMPFHRGELTRGQMFTQVGFGGTEFHGFGATGFPILDGLGEKRSVDLVIADLNDEDILYGDAAKNTCFADSGGPAIARIAGIDTVIAVSSSFISGPLCHGVSSSQRTSAELTFLDSFVAPSPVDGGARDGGVHDGGGRDGGVGDDGGVQVDGGGGDVGSHTVAPDGLAGRDGHRDGNSGCAISRSPSEYLYLLGLVAVCFRRRGFSERRCGSGSGCGSGDRLKGQVID